MHGPDGLDGLQKDGHAAHESIDDLFFPSSSSPLRGAVSPAANSRLGWAGVSFLLPEAQSLNELSGALDNRTLTLTAKEQEAKIKKLEQDLKVQETKLKKLESEFKSGKEQCKTASVTLEKLADAARAR
uniref:Uncharacterized protein n=1 Tax=Oryza barthii TaxID=65489 RepID=A0A0D3F7C7_9ORYZ